jgi:hypothetical protein
LAIRQTKTETPKRLEQHFKAWEQLETEAAEKTSQYDHFFQSPDRLMTSSP